MSTNRGLLCFVLLAVAAIDAAFARDTRLSPGGGGLDEHTIALWLFDDPQYPQVTLTEASWRHSDLRLLAGGQLVAGRFGNALKIIQNDSAATMYAQIARPSRLPLQIQSVDPSDELLATLKGSDWTCEFWLKLNGLPDTEAAVVDVYDSGTTAFYCGLAAGGSGFIVRGGKTTSTMLCSTNASALEDGSWHHVALCSTNSEIQHFLDGRTQAPARLINHDKPVKRRASFLGLIGVVYGDSSFSRPSRIEISTAMNHEWGTHRGNDWSERWRGSIIAPIEGRVNFRAESATGIRLSIGGDLIIDGLKNRAVRSGSFEMTAGGIVPISCAYVQKGGNAQLRLYWSWDGHKEELIPGKAFSFDSTDITAAKAAVGVSSGSPRHFQFRIGTDINGERRLDCLLDELRISDVGRYKSPFSPPASFSRNYGPRPPKPSQPSGSPLLFAEDAPDSPLAIGSRKHLFIDAAILARQQNVEIVANAPLRKERVDWCV